MPKVTTADFKKKEVWPPKYYQDFAEKYNLELEVTSPASFYIKGKSFVTEKGTRVNPAFGYMRPTGKSRVAADGSEEIEVICLHAEKTAWLPLNVLQPIRLIDSLEGKDI